MQLILVVGKVDYDQSDLPNIIILLKVSDHSVFFAHACTLNT